MLFTADLHTHSKYAGATSPALCLETLHQWALIKGIDVVSTGDFTHPAWIKELQEKLQPADNGFYRLKQLPQMTVLPFAKPEGRTVYFCLSVEVSCKYRIGARNYRTHHLIYAKDFKTAHRINQRLSKYGNLAEDGRPTLHLPSHQLFKIVLEIPGAYFVPAHIWTPWCSAIGAMEGHDSLQDCFKDVSQELFAVETSLSADPLMCSRYDALDNLTLLSNSDAHSARNLGREVNLLNTELSYDAMFGAFKTKEGFLGTYELFPQKGKCYNTGHRNCKISLSSEEVISNICSQCGKPLTVGVSHRVEQLATREAEAVITQPFKYVLPLPEVFAEILGVKASNPLEALRVAKEYAKAVSCFGNEFAILHKALLEDLERHHRKLSISIERLRNNEKRFTAGYDGRYGRIYFFEKEELKEQKKQLMLFA